MADTKRNSFSKVSPLLFVPMLCLLDNCLQSVPNSDPVPTCGLQYKKRKLASMKLKLQAAISTYRIQPTVSQIYIIKKSTLHKHALETFWLTVCEFSNVIKRRQLGVCGGGNGHRDNYPTCKNGL